MKLVSVLTVLFSLLWKTHELHFGIGDLDLSSISSSINVLCPRGILVTNPDGTKTCQPFIPPIKPIKCPPGTVPKPGGGCVRINVFPIPPQFPPIPPVITPFPTINAHNLQSDVLMSKSSHLRIPHEQIQNKI